MDRKQKVQAILDKMPSLNDGQVSYVYAIIFPPEKKQAPTQPKAVTLFETTNKYGPLNSEPTRIAPASAHAPRDRGVTYGEVDIEKVPSRCANISRAIQEVLGRRSSKGNAIPQTIRTKLKAVHDRLDMVAAMDTSSPSYLLNLWGHLYVCQTKIIKAMASWTCTDKTRETLETYAFYLGRYHTKTKECIEATPEDVAPELGDDYNG